MTDAEWALFDEWVAADTDATYEEWLQAREAIA